MLMRIRLECCRIYYYGKARLRHSVVKPECSHHILNGFVLHFIYVVSSVLQ
jgi:hypothetical protein